jgi:hypothetical protein
MCTVARRSPRGAATRRNSGNSKTKRSDGSFVALPLAAFASLLEAFASLLEAFASLSEAFVGLVAPVETASIAARIASVIGTSGAA